jgi:hypothetical protein
MENCRGCRIGSRCLIDNYIAEKCPCRICLVKVVCEEACEGFDAFCETRNKLVKD